MLWDRLIGNKFHTGHLWLGNLKTKDPIPEPGHSGHSTLTHRCRILSSWIIQQYKYCHLRCHKRWICGNRLIYAKKLQLKAILYYWYNKMLNLKCCRMENEIVWYLLYLLFYLQQFSILWYCNAVFQFLSVVTFNCLPNFILNKNIFSSRITATSQ